MTNGIPEEVEKLQKELFEEDQAYRTPRAKLRRIADASGEARNRAATRKRLRSRIAAGNDNSPGAKNR